MESIPTKVVPLKIISNQTEIENVLNDSDVHTVRILSDFVSRKPIEVNLDSLHDVVADVIAQVLEYCEHLPHNRLVVKVKNKGNCVAEIVVFPITSAA